MQNKSSRVGETYEESVKDFFIKNGYFTIKGLLYKDGKHLITDVDIWGYKNFGSYSYEKIIVDCKNKKRPKMAERILWTIGLKSSLSIEKAFVAVNKRNYEFQEFAVKNNIQILDPSVIDVKTNFENIVEDEFYEILNKNESVGSLFKENYEELKSLAIGKLDIKSLNKVLYIVKHFIERHSINPDTATFRMVLFSLSILFLLLDMLHMKYKSISEEYSMNKILDGIKYGDDTNKIKQFSEVISKITNEPYNKIYNQLLEQGSTNIEIVKEGILQKNDFFETALMLNNYAYAKVVTLNSIAKSKILIFCDYFDVKRIDFQLDISDNT